MWKKGKKIIAFSLLLVALAACGSSKSLKPVGVGRDVNEYKRSPCACTEIPQDFSNWGQG